MSQKQNTAGRKPLPPGQKKVPVTIYVEKSKINLIGHRNFRVMLESFARETISEFEDIKMMYERNLPFIVRERPPLIREFDIDIVIEDMKKRGVIE